MSSPFQQSFGDSPLPPLVMGSVLGLRTYSVVCERYDGKDDTYGFLSDGRPIVEDPYRLIGSYSYSWPSSEMKAECLSPKLFEKATREQKRDVKWPHEAPDENCTCGIYAYWPSELNCQKSVGNYTAIVEGYGKVILGTNGFKAEKVRIKGVTYSKSWRFFENRTKSKRAKLIAERYNVPYYKNLSSMLSAFPSLKEYFENDKDANSLHLTTQIDSKSRDLYTRRLLEDMLVHQQEAAEAFREMDRAKRESYDLFSLLRRMI